MSPRYNNFKTFNLSTDGFRITGKDAVISEVNIHNPSYLQEVPVFGGSSIEIECPPQPIEVNITLLCNPENFIQEFWDDDYDPGVSKKVVGDCTIRELLFAVREKAKNE